MIEEKFTPDISEEVIFSDYMVRKIADCIRGGEILGSVKDENIKSDLEHVANLVTAAPEMYAVLVGVFKVLDIIDFEITIEKRDLREIVSNVLKKARGES